MEPADVELAAVMFSDHSEEYFAELRAVAAARADGQMRPDPPWVQRPWYERLAGLTMPVTVVVASSSSGETIASRARDAEIIEVTSGGVMAPAGRLQAAEVFLGMLDRISVVTRR